MWTKLAHIVLKNRLTLIIILGLITVFMAYNARDVQFSYSLFTAVPDEDPDMMYFTQFKENFGEDANILAIGINDSALYEVENFRRFKYLSDELLTINLLNILLQKLHLIVQAHDIGFVKTFHDF